MSVFKNINRPIDESYFKDNEWEEDGWGSPYTRSHFNTLIYEKILTGKYMEDGFERKVQCDFIYFPEDWEGQFGDGRTEVRGFITCQFERHEPGIYGIKTDNSLDLESFMQAMLKNDKKLKEITKLD